VPYAAARRRLSAKSGLPAAAAADGGSGSGGSVGVGAMGAIAPILRKRARKNTLNVHTHTRTHAHTHPFNGPFSGATQASRYQKGKTNLDFTEAGDSEWQWHQLGRMQVCTLLQADKHTSTPPVCFYWPDALPAAQPTASKH